jgi:hypothetical protein
MPEDRLLADVEALRRTVDGADYSP